MRVVRDLLRKRGGQRNPLGRRDMSRLDRRHRAVDGRVVVLVPCRSFVFLTLHVPDQHNHNV